MEKNCGDTPSATLMDFQRNRENDGLTVRENKIEIFIENEKVSGCFLSTNITFSWPPPLVKTSRFMRCLNSFIPNKLNILHF